MGKKPQKEGRFTENLVFTNLRRVFTLLWATVSILLILAAIYITFRGTVR